MKSESFARNLMEQLEVDHLTDEYPHEISGGEKQRIALIRAFATKPDLLLLDEPFAALDDQTREKSRKQLLDIHKQWRIPMILVSHNRKDANILADQRIIMEKGRLIKETQALRECKALSDVDRCLVSKGSILRRNKFENFFLL